MKIIQLLKWLNNHPIEVITLVGTVFCIGLFIFLIIKYPEETLGGTILVGVITIIGCCAAANKLDEEDNKRRGRGGDGDDSEGW